MRNSIRRALEAHAYYGREVTVSCDDWVLYKRHGQAGVEQSGLPSQHRLGHVLTCVEVPVSSLQRVGPAAGGVFKACADAFIASMEAHVRPWEPILLYMRAITCSKPSEVVGIMLKYPHMEWYVQDGDDDRGLFSIMGVPLDRVLESKYAAWSAREVFHYVDLSE